MNWQFISFFGDSTLLLPTAVLIFILLLFSAKEKKVTWHWIFLFSATGFLVCISKLAFMGWGIGSRKLDFTGFSGHSALSACLFPALFWLLSSRFSRGKCYLAVSFGFIFAMLIGFSRLMLGAHSISEVIAGLLLGMMASGTFLLLQCRYSKIFLSYSKMTVVLALLLILLNTKVKIPTQSFLENIAVALNELERPYTRIDLHIGVNRPNLNNSFYLQN